MLAEQPGALFIGQGVSYSGHNMFKHLEGIPDSQRVEFPVAEELQLSACCGLAMEGFLPISIFPRMDFMLRAMDSLVNHLDKIEQMSCGQFKPKVIIRTRVGSKKPLDAGPQHTQNHTEAFRHMLKSVHVVEIQQAEDILSSYRNALKRDHSTLLVENL